MFFFNFTKRNTEEFEYDELMFFSCVKIVIFGLFILFSCSWVHIIFNAYNKPFMALFKHFICVLQTFTKIFTCI
jgi:hypothetical protein